MYYIKHYIKTIKVLIMKYRIDLLYLPAKCIRVMMNDGFVVSLVYCPYLFIWFK